MTTERTADANDEHEVEGQAFRMRATEADQPQPAGGEGAETEGHVLIRYKATEADQPQPAGGEGAETEGHTFRMRASEEPAPGDEPEVEGHTLSPAA